MIAPTGDVDNGIATRVSATREVDDGSATRMREVYDPTFQSTGISLPNRLIYSQSATVSSCEEVAFETLRDYAVWHEEFMLEQSLPGVATAELFSRLTQTNTGSTTSIMQDVLGRLLEQPSFYRRQPTALSLWDRNRSRARTYHHDLFRPNLTWHKQRADAAAAEGWSTEYLEELQDKQERLAALVGQWMHNQRWLVSELIKDLALFNDVRAESARRQLASQFGMGADLLRRREAA